MEIEEAVKILKEFVENDDWVRWDGKRVEAIKTLITHATRPSEKMELDEKKLRNFINEQEIPLNNLYGDRLAKAICRTFSHPQVKLPKKFVCCCKHISVVGEVKCICGASYFNAALDKVREMNGGEFQPQVTLEQKELITIAKYFLECLEKGWISFGGGYYPSLRNKLLEFINKYDALEETDAK